MHRSQQQKQVNLMQLSKMRRIRWRWCSTQVGGAWRGHFSRLGSARKSSASKRGLDHPACIDQARSKPAVQPTENCDLCAKPWPFAGWLCARSSTCGGWARSVAEFRGLCRRFGAWRVVRQKT